MKIAQADMFQYLAKFRSHRRIFARQTNFYANRKNKHPTLSGRVLLNSHHLRFSACSMSRSRLTEPP